jgi:hypothetical protein
MLYRIHIADNRLQPPNFKTVKKQRQKYAVSGLSPENYTESDKIISKKITLGNRLT